MVSLTKYTYAVSPMIYTKNAEELVLLNPSDFMAKIMGIETSHINKVFNKKGKGAGAKFCGAVMKYCEENDLNYKDFIILD